MYVFWREATTVRRYTDMPYMVMLKQAKPPFPVQMNLVGSRANNFCFFTITYLIHDIVRRSTSWKWCRILLMNLNNWKPQWSGYAKVIWNHLSCIFSGTYYATLNLFHLLGSNFWYLKLSVMCWVNNIYLKRFRCK
jgi:hypothetical protein